MKHIVGNLVDLFSKGEFDVIVHGCNCGNTMGAGIAKEIKEKYPEAYEADCETKKFDRNKLGTYSKAHLVVAGSQRIILNAYTQFHWKGGGVLCDYYAVNSVFEKIKVEFGGRGLTFGIPAIGCGRAGGDWGMISAIIEEAMCWEDTTFVEFGGVDSKGDFRRNMK